MCKLKRHIQYMYIQKYTYTCIYIHTIQTHICAHIHEYIPAALLWFLNVRVTLSCHLYTQNTHMHIRIHIHKHTYRNTYAHMHMCINICIYIYIYILTYTPEALLWFLNVLCCQHLYTQTQVYTYAYTHTYLKLFCGF